MKKYREIVLEYIRKYLMCYGWSQGADINYWTKDNRHIDLFSDMSMSYIIKIGDSNGYERTYDIQHMDDRALDYFIKG